MAGGNEALLLIVLVHSHDSLLGVSLISSFREPCTSPLPRSFHYKPPRLYRNADYFYPIQDRGNERLWCEGHLQWEYKYRTGSSGGRCYKGNWCEIDTAV